MHSTTSNAELAMGARAGKLRVVRGDDDGATLGGKLAKRRREIAAPCGIKRCRRFVHEEDVWIDRQCSSDRDTLRLSA